MSRAHAVSRLRRIMPPKMRMVATNATPAEAKWIALSGVKVHVVKSRPSTVGRQLWKTIAPVMFPIASVSLPLRTQSTLLNFSGSSVAIGAMMSARMVGSRPITCREVLDRADEHLGAHDDQAQGKHDLGDHDRHPRLAAGHRVRTREDGRSRASVGR